jgi:hypothetical protein
VRVSEGGGRVRSVTRARRAVFATGALCVSMGASWMIPILFALSAGEALDSTGARVAWVGPALGVSGLLLLAAARHRSDAMRLPAPVRIAIVGVAAFLCFCALETSDGLVRQQGRVFYWTSVLFLPALALLYGLVLIRPWAWRIARLVTAGFATWFVAVAAFIPFADVQTHGVPVPPWGRVWMIGVSLAFAASAGNVFRALGHTDSRARFGVGPAPAPGGPAG